jgi:hypothetical protein
MRAHVIRRNPGTGNWVVYWYYPAERKYLITGAASSLKFALAGLN